MKYCTIFGAALIVAVSAAPGQAAAETITFDEFAYDNSDGALPSARYSGLGVTFSSADDGTTWGGLSNGDPGNWDLEGTNGAGFSGFNGDSYAMTMLFDSDIGSFSMDASRSAGSVAGDSITLEAYFNGVLVDMTSAIFGDVNTWLTLSLTGLFDEIRWFGSGEGFHPFGVDNINFAFVDGEIPLPAALPVFLTGLAGLGFARGRKRRAA